LHFVYELYPSELFIDEVLYLLGTGMKLEKVSNAVSVNLRQRYSLVVFVLKMFKKGEYM
jgi:hypothetical protein